MTPRLNTAQGPLKTVAPPGSTSNLRSRAIQDERAKKTLYTRMENLDGKITTVSNANAKFVLPVASHYYPEFWKWFADGAYNNVGKVKNLERSTREGRQIPYYMLKGAKTGPENDAPTFAMLAMPTKDVPTETVHYDPDRWAVFAYTGYVDGKSAQPTHLLMLPSAEWGGVQKVELDFLQERQVMKYLNGTERNFYAPKYEARVSRVEMVPAKAAGSKSAQVNVAIQPHGGSTSATAYKGNNQG